MAAFNFVKCTYSGVKFSVAGPRSAIGRAPDS